MSIKSDDDDVDYKDYRPGSIGELFEEDDLDINEIDSNETVEEDIEVDESEDEDISEEDWSQYMADDTDNTHPVKSDISEDIIENEVLNEIEVEASQEEVPEVEDSDITGEIFDEVEEDQKILDQLLEEGLESEDVDYIENEIQEVIDEESEGTEKFDSVEEVLEESTESLEDKDDDGTYGDGTVDIDDIDTSEDEDIEGVYGEDSIIDTDEVESEEDTETILSVSGHDSDENEDEDEKEPEPENEDSEDISDDEDEDDQNLNDTEESNKDVIEERYSDKQTEGTEYDSTVGGDIEEKIVEDEDPNEEDGPELIEEQNEEIEAVSDDSEKEIVKETVKTSKPKNGFSADDIEEPDEYNTQNLNALFKMRVKKIFEHYPPETINKWLFEAKQGGPDKLQILKDFYIREFCIYHNDVNFNHPNAKSDLWTLVAYDYYQYEADETYKREGTYVQSVLPSEYLKDGVIVEDENVKKMKELHRKNQEKYKSFALDRTIFDISDEEDIENTSIFEDKKTLMKEFYESPFYKILKEVMESDEIVNMNDIKCKVTINERTSDLPIIDFSTGIRCVCIDTADIDQYHINAMLLSKKVPFSFPIQAGAMRTRILYSDSCKQCPIAVISSLRKLIAYRQYKDRYKVKLKSNYTVAYTTERKYIDMFEQGDPDSKTAGASTYPTPKASNMGIGIIVVDKKSDKDRQNIRRNQFRRDSGNEYNKMTTDDYNIYFVLSARIIKNDLRLRDPTYPRNERFVEYTIVQYSEHNKIVIEDGFQTICACIIKEHNKMYDPGTNYAINYELDRDNLVSPAIVGMIDERDGIEPSVSKKVPHPLEINHQFILPPSRLAMDGVYQHEKGRIDPRFFSPSSIQHSYTERSLWQNYDITTPQGRVEFIKSRGFEEFYVPAQITFDVMPYALDMVESSEYIRNITKVSVQMLADRNSEDTNNLLFRQHELEYIKSMGTEGSYGGMFQRFLRAVLDFVVDQKQQQSQTA